MKTVLLITFMSLAAVQFVPPPPIPQAPPAPPQRGQAAGTATPQPAPLNAAQCKCSIEVTVKHSTTGEPLSDIEVTLTPPNRAAANAATLEDFLAAQAAARAAGIGSNPVSATTDNSGRVVFRDLEEGSYSIAARLDGYFGVLNDTFPAQATASVPVGPALAQNGARGTPPPGVTVVVPPRQPIQQITLNMVQGSTIAGRIQDANRRPATGVQVGAYRVAYQNGHRVLNQVGSAVTTDDRGEYRLFWFPPGEYYVRTGGARAGFTAAGGLNYPVSTYYPGTSDPRTGSMVVVREGINLAGIDIALQPANGVTVSGTILNTIPGGRLGPNGQVNRSVSSIYLVPRNPVFFENPLLLPVVGGAARGARGGAANDSESAFEIRGVPPGSYDFYPVYTDGSTGTGANGLPPYFTARTPIEVGSENVTGIQSVIKPGANLKGKVTVTGTAPASGRGQAQSITLTSLRVQIQPKENIPSLARAAINQLPTLDADGMFTVANLVDGQYFIQGVNPLPADAYVSEIRLDSRSVYDEDILVIGKDSQTTLDVVISRGGGTIQGTVLDANHNPVVSRITLVPDPPRRQNVFLYKNAASNAMGVFNLVGVAPGAYKIFAWEKNPGGAEQDPDFLREYDVLGSSVNVAPGLAVANIAVTLIPAKH